MARVLNYGFGSILDINIGSVTISKEAVMEPKNA